jgi:hypothetical protein
MKAKHIIRLTAEISNCNSSMQPVKRYNLHERINYRGTNPVYHIYNNAPFVQDISHNARLGRYEERCIENGIKPFHYTDEEFNYIMNDIAGEQYASQQAAKFEAAYIY